MELKDKDVVVLGLGRSGMAAAELLQRDGARVVVRDEGDTEELVERANRLRQLGVRVELGNRFDVAAHFDLAVLSPGIAPERPLVTELVRQRTPVLSELEFAYRYCLCPIVAITGTNGKTTTTELIHAMLESAGKRTATAGNIGNAFAAAVEQSAGLDAVVLETSSFQLERIEQFRPDVAIWLNLTPDHIDRHGSMEAYAKAKARIFENQTSQDYAIVSTSVLAWMNKVGCRPKSRVITVSAYGQEADLRVDWTDGQTIWCRLPECNGILMKMDETNLRGLHNAENILAAFAAGLAMKLPVAAMREAICSYCPQPHRGEVVAVKDGVTFINDSKATNVDAVEKALRALPGRVVLIAGGRDKGLNFSSIKEVIAEKVKVAVLIGEARDKMVTAWSDVTPCERAATMAEAVRVATAQAGRGDTVLLSPACASFDMFANYEDRGDKFKEAVLTLL
ncbi:MAG: UDP-N-acetylmuramoylalanine--D-glutamate ligase [Verrucomicrobiae bacterium]|nr:UDP-N-acetylmuramoylalanine--D-glutamate ligase [Verrucomicrobiae bacterium]